MNKKVIYVLAALLTTLPHVGTGAPVEVHPQYEGLDTQVYLTVTPTPKHERYESAFYAIERAALIAEGPAEDARVVPFFVKDVEARHGRLEIRQYDAQKDVLTEVWIDGSASMAPCEGRGASARAAALCCATGLGEGGRVRLGVLRDGEATPLFEATEPGQMRHVLEALSSDVPAARANLATALPRLPQQVARGARFLLVSDLLTRADAGVLHAFAGRGVRGALLHMRVPEVHTPAPGTTFRAHDAETGATRSVRLDGPAAGRIAARARAHADLWAQHAQGVTHPGDVVKEKLRITVRSEIRKIASAFE